MYNKKMKQYKVPQNVQREDTIIGPLTLKQLAILGIGGGIAYAIYVTLAKTYFIEVWLPPVAIVTIITLAFTFIKVYDLPFHIYLMSLIEYKILPKKRIWVQRSDKGFIPPQSKKKEEKKVEEVEEKNKKTIEELTEILDTHGGSEKSTDNQKEIAENKIKKHHELENIIKQNYK